MGRVRVRDQYQAEHWIDEAVLPYAPWRDYEVIAREAEPPAEAAPETPEATPPTEPEPPKPSSKAGRINPDDK